MKEDISTTSRKLLAGPRWSLPRPNGRRRAALRVGISLITVFVLLLTGLFISRRTRGSGPVDSASADTDSAQTATVTRGEFVTVLRLTGSTQAVRSRAIMVPALAGSQLQSLVVTTLTPGGTKVKQGDLLVEFDRQSQTKDFLDKQAEYQKLVDQIIGKEAAEAAARAKDETELKQAESAFEKAKLELQKNEVISSIEAEKNQTNLEETTANLKQLRETFELKRRAARADIRIVEIQRDRARASMKHSQANAQKMVVRSPMNGVIVLNTIWKSGRMAEVQVGDEVRPGVPFMQVVDPSTMEVTVRVNQEDIRQLHTGQHARMHLDAYPNLEFPATLDDLAPLGVRGQFSSKMHTFTAHFSVLTSDPKLMPDLSAAVDVELERLPNVLLAPSDSVLMENGRATVLVKSAPSFEKRVVKTGPRNSLYTVIESGVRAGEVIKRNVSAFGNIEG
jgi:multidrug resistance efflux pump